MLLAGCVAFMTVEMPASVMCENILKYRVFLSEWDREFVEDMKERAMRGDILYDKQRSKLYQIWRKHRNPSDTESV